MHLLFEQQKGNLIVNTLKFKGDLYDKACSLEWTPKSVTMRLGYVHKMQAPF